MVRKLHRKSDVPMSRFLLPAFLLAALTFTSTASADTGTFAIHTGGVRLDHGDQTDWRPNLNAQFAFELIGPLQAGVWGNVMASDLPLKNPAFGGGLVVALRPTIPVLRLQPILEVAGGRTQIAVDQSDKESAWLTSISGGLGVLVTNSMRVEVRVSHAWLFQLSEGSTLQPRTWTGSVGLSFDIP